MANNLGHLPKASELSETNSSRLDKWYEKAYEDDNLFRTLANDEMTLDMFLSWVGLMYGGSSGLDTQMIELCRIRMANVNECFHWSLVKSASLVRTGLTDEVIQKLDDYENSNLPDAWKAALALSDHLAGSPKGPIPDKIKNKSKQWIKKCNK